MSNFVKVDDAKLIKKMKKYEQVVGKEVEQLVKNAARLCALECMKYTGPRGKGSADKKRGEGRIRKDFRGLFTSVKPEWWKEVINMGENKREILRHTKTGIIWARDTQETIDSLESAEMFHKKNYRNGKARHLGLLDRAIIKQATYRKYLRETMKKVGIAKAGWALAAQKCDADVREPMKGVPSWVNRNLERAAAKVRTKSGKGMTHTVSMTNKVKYSRETLDPQNEEFAINVAKKKMISMMNHAIRYVKTKEAGLTA
jgi:hypothetical protein